MKDVNLLSEYPLNELIKLLYSTDYIENPKEDNLIQELIRRLVELEGRVEELEEESVKYVKINNVNEL